MRIIVGIKFLAESGGTPSKSKSEFRVGWRSRDDYYYRYRDYRYRSFFCVAVFFALQFFLRCSFFCAAVFFAPQFFLRRSFFCAAVFCCDSKSLTKVSSS